MNYNQRLDFYRQNNYFQINNGHLDLYAKKLPEWYQKIDVLKDLLTLASKEGLQNEYDILFVRVFGGDMSEEVSRTLQDNALVVNMDLAKELGPSEYWKTMKFDSTIPCRHFAAVCFSSYTRVAKLEPKPVETVEPEIVETEVPEVIEPFKMEEENVTRRKPNRKQEPDSLSSV